MSQSNRKGQRKRKQHSDFQGIHYVIGRGGKQRLRAQKLYAMKQGQTAPYISGEAPEGMYGEATALSRHMIRKHLHQCYKQAVKSTEPRKD